jgi:DivIVA domain-containing protein
MEQDDPEQRIAELERQLSDAEPAGTDRGLPPLTAADIKRMAFSRPPIGKRGYNEDEVDAFLDLVEERLLNPSSDSLTAVDVQNIAFSKPPIGKRGYNEDEVDAFLDLVESEISRLDGTLGRPATNRQHLAQAEPATADSGSRRGSGLRSIGVRDWLTVIIAVGLYLFMLGSLARDFYGYQVGTPLTATDIRCWGGPAGGDGNDPHYHCIGTWSIGGQSRTGSIERVPGDWTSQPSLNVRVHGDTAYGQGSSGWRFGLSLLFLVFVITLFLGGFRAVDRRWRQWRSRRRHPG